MGCGQRSAAREPLSGHERQVTSLAFSPTARCSSREAWTVPSSSGTWSLERPWAPRWRPIDLRSGVSRAARTARRSWPAAMSTGLLGSRDPSTARHGHHLAERPAVGACLQSRRDAAGVSGQQLGDGLVEGRATCRARQKSGHACGEKRPGSDARRCGLQSEWHAAGHQRAAACRRSLECEDRSTAFDVTPRTHSGSHRRGLHR